MIFQLRLGLSLLATICSLGLIARTVAGTSNSTSSTQLPDFLLRTEKCIVQAAFTFRNESNLLATNAAEFQASCQSQTAAYKCLKDALKKHNNVGGLIRRGIGTFVTSRSRFTKKFCANINSAATKKLIEAQKCIVEKRFAVYKEAEYAYASDLLSLQRSQGLGDKELKYFCCATLRYKHSIVEGIGKECEASRASISELALSVIPEEVSLVCGDDDEKSMDECNKLKPLRAVKYEGKPGTSPEVVSMLLLATFGDRQ